MDINELIAMVTEGLPAEQAAVVKAAIERDAVKAKASAIKSQKEAQDLVDRAAALQADLDGQPDKPGAKAYREWYEKNFAAVQKLQDDLAKYQAKHGPIDAAAPPPNPQPQPGLTADDIQRAVDKRIQEQYAPRWADLLTSTGTVVQKHMFAGRKSPIDFTKLAELAPKYNGNLEMAYDEWDKPEREKADSASREAEITRRVNEELQKRGSTARFPGGADATPGALSARSKADLDKFDKNTLKQDLARTFLEAGTEKVQ